MLFAPEFVDQAIGRDEVVRIEKQQREQSPFLRAADAKWATGVPHLERSEEAKVHQPWASASTTGR